jgi:hypothetical protein
MRVMVIVKATVDSEKGMDFGDPKVLDMMTAMGKFNDALKAAGMLVTAAGLQPSSVGCRVHFDGAGRTVSNGPFAQPNELVAGFWVWDVKDMDDAIAWVKRCPNPMFGPSDIEIRPFYEFGNPQ